MRERCAQEAERITGRRRVLASLLNNEAVKPCEVAAAIRKIDVHHAIAPLQAEVEALRAEVDGTIRKLLAALEAAREDADRIAFLAMEPVIEGFVDVDRDVYEYASDCAEENGRDEPNDEDQINGMRRLIDAAIEQARKKENGNVR